MNADCRSEKNRCGLGFALLVIRVVPHFLYYMIDETTQGHSPHLPGVEQSQIIDPYPRLPLDSRPMEEMPRGLLLRRLLLVLLMGRLRSVLITDCLAKIFWVTVEGDFPYSLSKTEFRDDQS